MALYLSRFAVAIELASQPTTKHTHTIVHTHNSVFFFSHFNFSMVYLVSTNVLTCSIKLHKPSASELKQTHI